MKQTIFVKTLMGIFCIPLICSCVDNERDLFQEPEKIPKEQFFDFDMNQSLALDIDYGFKEEYTVLFLPCGREGSSAARKRSAIHRSSRTWRKRTHRKLKRMRSRPWK